jgi:hypothetical protein
MKIISRRVHGVLDYLVGVLLILAPKLFGFDTGGPEQMVPVTLGIVAILYSAVTRYELGALGLLPFRRHLTLDVLHGLVLALSPWLFQFSDRVWVPHLALGCAEILVVAMTRATESEQRTNATGAAARL